MHLMLASSLAVWLGCLSAIAAPSDISVSSPSNTRAPVDRSLEIGSPAPVAPPRTRPKVGPVKRAARKPSPAQTAGAPAPAPRAASKVGAEESVNLNAITTDSTSAGAPSVDQGSSTSVSASGTSTGSIKPTHSFSGAMPNFKFYYDFMLVSRPGVHETSFDSYHQLFMVEIVPTPSLMFTADVIGQRFFEGDYQVSPKLQLRWGKIWIPFDDMAPHNIFGGRVNVSKFANSVNDKAFLPDIWADYGLGAKYTLADSVPFSMDMHLCVVNGFGSSGPGNATADPTGEGAEYPDLGSAQAPDNNSNKAFVFRGAAKFYQRLGIGTSFYRGAYTAEGQPSQNVTMVGLDTQFRPTSSTEFRAGAVYMKIGLNQPASKDGFRRGGVYVEGGQRFGTDSNWKLLVRGGIAQNDNRVIDTSDRKIVGASILRQAGPVQLSIEHNRDLNRVPGKSAFLFTAFRVVTAF